jgi:hypothetical protein
VQLGFSMKLSHYVQCRILFIILLKVILLNVVMVSVAGPKVQDNFSYRKHSTRLKMSVSIKRISLFYQRVNSTPKKFYNIGPLWQREGVIVERQHKKVHPH